MSDKRSGWKRKLSLTVPCPKCGARDGDNCIGRSGRRRVSSHIERHSAVSFKVKDVKGYKKNARKQHANNYEWAKIRARVFAEKGFNCAYCGDDAGHVDHVVPICRGGTNEIENLVPCCNKCNSAKGALLVKEWAE